MPERKAGESACYDVPMQSPPEDLIETLGRKYMWWPPVGGEPHPPARIIAQVMNLGTYEDIRRLEGVVTPERLAEVMRAAQPGWLVQPALVGVLARAPFGLRPDRPGRAAAKVDSCRARLSPGPTRFSPAHGTGSLAGPLTHDDCRAYLPQREAAREGETLTMEALTLSVLGLAITAAVPVAAQTDTVRSGQRKGYGHSSTAR